MRYGLYKVIREIHRRSVWQVLGVYLAMSWGALNAVDVLTGFAGLPDWTPTMALVLLLIGLPVVTATAVVQGGWPRADDPHEAIHPDDVEGRTPDEVLVVPEHHPMHRTRIFTWRNAVLGGVMAGALLVTAVSAYFAMWALGIGPVGSLVAQGVLDERDVVLLTEFENRTDESSLGSVVTEALSVDLGMSDVVRLASPDLVEDALRRMGRSRDTRLTAEVAREVAEREGIKATIEGEISRVGSRYLLTSRIVLPATGEAAASLREAATGPEDLLPAIDRLSTRLRQRAGESLRAIRRSAPLEQVTTASLEALRLYTEGLRLENAGAYPEARAALVEATALDTAFAMAYRKLAVLESNTGNLPAARRFAALAHRHADRLTDVERHLARAFYHSTVTGQSDSTIAAYRSVLRLDPAQPTALNNLGLQLLGRGQASEAAELFAQAVERHGQSWTWSINLGTALMVTGDMEGAKRAFAAFDAAYPDHPLTPETRMLSAMVSGDVEATHEAATAVAMGPGPGFARAQAELLRVAVDIRRGRIREAREHRWSAGLDGADFLLFFTASPEALEGEVRDAMRRSGFEATPPEERRWDVYVVALALSGNGTDARALLDRWGREAPPQGPREYQRRLAEATVLAAEGAYAEAIRQVDAAEVQCEPCTDWVAAPLFEVVGDTLEAIRRWERLRDHPNEPTLLPAARTIANLRLAPLYEAVGDTASALAAHRFLVDAWADADPELQPRVAEARARIAALGGAPRPE